MSTASQSLRGTPASAGIGRSKPGPRSLGCGYPRVSGDRPSVSPWQMVQRKVPPRQRGSAVRSIWAARRSSGTPASAGIGRTDTHVSNTCLWYPRVSGDRPSPLCPTRSPNPVPPRQRGSAYPPRSAAECPLGTPASAGIGPPFRSRLRTTAWYPLSMITLMEPAMCTLMEPLTNGHFDLVPAVWYPRVSGDRPLVLSLAPSSCSVPPRQRGSAPRRAPKRRSHRGTPAPAGIGPAIGDGPSLRPCQPRTSGDRPVGSSH